MIENLLYLFASVVIGVPLVFLILGITLVLRDIFDRKLKEVLKKHAKERFIENFKHNRENK